jgi:hypothetical protein
MALRTGDEFRRTVAALQMFSGCAWLFQACIENAANRGGRYEAVLSFGRFR